MVVPCRDPYFTTTFHVERQLLPQTPPAYPAEERFTPSKDERIYPCFTTMNNQGRETTLFLNGEEEQC